MESPSCRTLLIKLVLTNPQPVFLLFIRIPSDKEQQQKRSITLDYNTPISKTQELFCIFFAFIKYNQAYILTYS